MQYPKNKRTRGPRERERERESLHRRRRRRRCGVEISIIDANASDSIASMSNVNNTHTCMPAPFSLYRKRSTTTTHIKYSDTDTNTTQRERESFESMSEFVEQKLRIKSAPLQSFCSMAVVHTDTHFKIAAKMQRSLRKDHCATEYIYRSTACSIHIALHFSREGNLPNAHSFQRKSRRDGGARRRRRLASVWVLRSFGRT